MRKVGVLVVISTLLLPGCGSKLPSIKPFKMDVQQGNEVNSKMLLQLRPGMSKSQVRYIMGTPLVVDSFHDNRWYYYYSMRKEGQVTDKRSVILDFDKESLLRVRGDVPNDDAVAKADTVTPPTSVAEAAVAPKNEKSWWDKLQFWGEGDTSGPVPPAEITPAPPTVATVPAEENPVVVESKVTAEPAVEAKSIEAVVAEPVATVPAVTDSNVANANAVNEMAEVKVVEEVAEAKVSKVEKSWWERLMFWKNDEASQSAATEVAVLEKPSVPELKATPNAEVEAPSATTEVVIAAPEPAPAPVASKAKPTESVVINSLPVVSPVKEVLRNDKEEIASTVASWAEAWRNKDLNAYLAKYADDFKPDGLPSKKAWEAQRKQRLSAKQGKISLDISDVQVQQNGNLVTVKFKQKYASKLYSDQVTKQLDLRLNPTSKKWLIVRETATPTK